MLGVGGAEWLIIALVVLALLVIPGLFFFGTGYYAGRRSAARDARLAEEDVSEAERTAPPAEPIAPEGDDDA
jgi:hypothetical protein